MVKFNSNSDIEKKTVEEKLELIDRIENSNGVNGIDFEVLEILSRDEDDEVRSRVAEKLVFFKTKDSEEILKRLLNDDVEMVRVNACDSLYFSKSKESIELLKLKVSKDKSSLVRGYATLSLADISNNTGLYKDDLSDFLIAVLSKERIKWVKINIFTALYLLGNKSYIDFLINELNNRYYRNRCAVVNSLGDILTDNNSVIIMEYLTKRNEVEKAISVKNAIDRVLQKMKVQG